MSVIERTGEYPDLIDTPMSWEDADRRAGVRLDRRKNWAFIRGELAEHCEFTHSCSGCVECEDGQPVGNYAWDSKAGCYVGAGCHECGYTGKRKNRSWVPAITP